MAADASPGRRLGRRAWRDGRGRDILVDAQAQQVDRLDRRLDQCAAQALRQVIGLELVAGRNDQVVVVHESVRQRGGRVGALVSVQATDSVQFGKGVVAQPRVVVQAAKERIGIRIVRPYAQLESGRCHCRDRKRCPEIIRMANVDGDPDFTELADDRELESPTLPARPILRISLHRQVSGVLPAMSDRAVSRSRSGGGSGLGTAPDAGDQ